MSTAARSSATLLVLVAVVAAWAFYGWSATTAPFPGRVAAPTCVDTLVPAGTRVFPADVTVSVLNGGTREGLAGRTMQQFIDQGFDEGDNDNAPPGTEVADAQIWTDDPGNPAVRLLASRIPGVEIVATASRAAGITVVVGDAFDELVEGKRRVKAQTDVTVCGPSAS